VGAKTAPQMIVGAARAVYGDQWRSPLAQSLALHPRTVRRIEQAARTGEPQPVSPGVLAELAALAREYADTLETSTSVEVREVRRLELIARELDEAARAWTPTRRVRKAGQ
jgi:hypothetical protein